MTYTIGEIRAKAGEATFAVVLAGACYAVSGAVGLVFAVRGHRDGLAGLVPYWVLLLPVLLLAGSIVLAGVTWLQWFAALHATAEPFGVVREGRFWRVWGWLIPVVNFFVPKRMVNDIWWTGDRDRRSPLPWQIQVWWLLWLGGLLADSSSVPADGNAPVLDAIGALLVGASTPFAVWTIRLLTLRVTQPSPGSAEPEVIVAGWRSWT